MLDMGFVEDIEAIFKQANPDARILLFSATMPEPILKIASQFMGDYEIVEEEGVVDEPLLIDQKFWVVRESDKIEALVRMIDYADDFYGIVFTQTKNDADHVTKALGVEKDKVFVKAKTGEKLDSVGNGNAIEAWCTCLLYK